VDANAGHPVRVGGRVEQAHDHFRVLLLPPGRRAVLAITGDVEDRAELGLQRQRLRDELLAPGEVLARRDHGERLLALEERLAGMDELGHGSLLGISTV
jgi:hypothetical protein